MAEVKPQEKHSQDLTMEGVAASISATTSNSQNKRQTRDVPQLAHCQLTARKGVSTPTAVGFYAKKGAVCMPITVICPFGTSHNSLGDMSVF